MISEEEDQVSQEQWAAYQAWRERNLPTAQSVAERYASALKGLDPSVPWEEVQSQAADRTREHFSPPAGAASVPYWRMTMYAPIYVANYCSNVCKYCGFRAPAQIVRRHLTPDEAVLESDLLFEHGFRNQLFLTGEDPQRATSEYLCEIVRRVVAKGRNPSVEIPPQSEEHYRSLAEAGVTSVTLFQETYNESLYTDYHPRGPKSHYRWRLGSQERGLAGGLQRVGFGFLVGLAPAYEELLAMMAHATYLMEKYPDRSFAFALPRIREAPDGFTIPYPASDDQFRRMYAVLRLAFPESESVISVREPAQMRNELCRTCLTQISAGSRTNPGGYAEEEAIAAGRSALHTSEQFPTTDNRTPREVYDWLQETGFHVCGVPVSNGNAAVPGFKTSVVRGG